MTETATTPDINAIKSKMKTIWTAGDFGKIAEIIQGGADEFIDRLNLKPGETVLDVACGTGNTAIPAAKKGAVVTGVDIAANSLEQARARAAERAEAARLFGLHLGDVVDRHEVVLIELRLNRNIAESCERRQDAYLRHRCFANTGFRDARGANDQRDTA